MEQEMVMEEDNNGEEVEYSFTAYEIDLDYEFDAVRFFDFSRAESPLESRRAEAWFDAAGSYPPSPFVRSIQKQGVLNENVNISPKSKGVEDINMLKSDSDIEEDQETSVANMNYRDDVQEKGTSTTRQIGSTQKFQNSCQILPSGLTFYNHMLKNNSKIQTKLSMKPSIPRTSTLMKPTASQLAKQNYPLHAGYSRPNISLDKTNKSSTSTCVIENQAAKRQKLEGGLLRKVEGAVQPQQTNFIHKVPKRDGLLYSNTTHTKPRITIPREPDLETAHRAQRTRPKSTKEDDNVAPAVRRFKALPLNKKILQAPSLIPKRSTPRLPEFQEFHLKTSGRAMHHNSAVSKSKIPSDIRDKGLNKNSTKSTSDFQSKAASSFLNSSSLDGCESSHSFKALPLNKKILASKGDIGVFRNSKKETTVPLEFNFQTEKRAHHNPPIELFNKLSLVSETPQTANSNSKLLQSSLFTKGSKENRWVSHHQGNEIKQPTKTELLMVGGKQQFTGDERRNGYSNASGTNWSKDVR